MLFFSVIFKILPLVAVYVLHSQQVNNFLLSSCSSSNLYSSLRCSSRRWSRVVYLSHKPIGLSASSCWVQHKRDRSIYPGEFIHAIECLEPVANLFRSHEHFKGLKKFIRFGNGAMLFAIIHKGVLRKLFCSG